MLDILRVAGPHLTCPLPSPSALQELVHSQQFYSWLHYRNNRVAEMRREEPTAAAVAALNGSTAQHELAGKT